MSIRLALCAVGGGTEKIPSKGREGGQPMDRFLAAEQLGGRAKGRAARQGRQPNGDKIELEQLADMSIS
jgi:hypothetical protein